MSAISVDITSLEARVWLAESMEADALLQLVEQLCTIRMNRHLALDGQGMPTCSLDEAQRAACFEGVAKLAKLLRASLTTLDSNKRVYAGDIVGAGSPQPHKAEEKSGGAG